MQAKEVDKKIKAFKAVLEIVNAMKAFAGINYRKCEEYIYSLREFENLLYQGIGNLLYFYPQIFPLKAERGQRLFIAFGSDQGLCGAYNFRLAEKLATILKKEDLLIIIGKKLQEISTEFNLSSLKNLSSAVSIDGIRDSLEELFIFLLELIQSQNISEIYVVFTSIIQKKPQILIEGILPPLENKLKPLPTMPNKPLLYLPPKKLLEKFIEELIFIGIYRAYLEALRSESWYRIRSMESASEAIERKVTELQIMKNYQRQEEITSEIVEILLGSKL